MVSPVKQDKRYRALIVDDVKSNILTLNEVLRNEYIIQVAMDGIKALELAKMSPAPDIILLDVIMPEMDGYEVCRQLKANKKTADIPVIFVTSMNEIEDETYGLQLGASDYLRKPITPDTCKVRIGNQLRLIRNRELIKNRKKLMERLVYERSLELSQTQDVTIQCIASLAETRDNETGNHILRTKGYVDILARELRDTPQYRNIITEGFIEKLCKSAPLHDIGKVGIPDNILLKPGKLTNEEFEIMKKHTIFGGEALEKAERKLGTDSFLRLAKEIAYSHHERWDGTGYPNHLKGENIPISGRIMSIVDVYDALISKRCYKPPFSHSKAVKIIKEGKGTQFDPFLVDSFLRITENMRLLAIEFTDDSEQKEALQKID